MRARFGYLTIYLGLLPIMLVACSVNLDPKKTSARVDEAELSTLAIELSEELIQKGIDSVAVVDFTDPQGRISEFEQNITERVFLSMTGFSGKLWVVNEGYFRNILETQKPPDEVWPIMGIKAIVSGTISTDSKAITLCLRVVDPETAMTISSITKECRVLSEYESIAYLTQPGLKARSFSDESEQASNIPTFPWPPPEASASTKVPSAFLRDPLHPASLADVATSLENAFSQTGYAERSYYAVPGGFALVSRLEQFNADGSSKQVPERWAVEVQAPRIFSLSSYLKALFLAQKGYFRIITFIVTSSPFVQNSETAIRQEEAMGWLASGSQILPSTIGSLPYTENHYCVALVYEFEQISRNHEPNFKQLSILPGIEHLKHSQLWEILEK